MWWQQAAGVGWVMEPELTGPLISLCLISMLIRGERGDVDKDAVEVGACPWLSDHPSSTSRDLNMNCFKNIAPGFFSSFFNDVIQNIGVWVVWCCTSVTEGQKWHLHHHHRYCFVENVWHELHLNPDWCWRSPLEQWAEQNPSVALLSEQKSVTSLTIYVTTLCINLNYCRFTKVNEQQSPVVTTSLQSTVPQ